MAGGGLLGVGDMVAGRYRVEAEVGRGGMGVVFRARDAQGRAVAVKVLLPEAVAHPEAVPRFITEAKAALLLTSEHTVRVFEAGTLDVGLPFMVMELLEGNDLSTILEKSGTFGVAETCDAILDACHGLAEAHARGMVHRDLKPSNLFAVRGPDGQPLVKVLDFGVSKVAAQVRNAALTSTGTILGSPHYTAPEQLKSAKGVDARADIWSLGVVAYELLVGKIPFDGRSFGELFMQIVSEPPRPITEARPDLPAGLAEVIHRCLAKDREQRFADLDALAEALAPYASARGVAVAKRMAVEKATRGTAAPLPSSSSMLAAPAWQPEAKRALGGTMLMSNAPHHVPGAGASLAPRPPQPSSPSYDDARSLGPRPPQPSSPSYDDARSLGPRPPQPSSPSYYDDASLVGRPQVSAAPAGSGTSPSPGAPAAKPASPARGLGAPAAIGIALVLGLLGVGLFVWALSHR